MYKRSKISTHVQNVYDVICMIMIMRVCITQLAALSCSGVAYGLHTWGIHLLCELHCACTSAFTKEKDGNVHYNKPDSETKYITKNFHGRKFLPSPAM